MNTYQGYTGPSKTAWPEMTGNTAFEAHLSLPPSGSEDVSLHFFHYQFTKIVENWNDHLQFVAYQMTSNKQVAEDIVQEAFLQLWKHRRRILPQNPVGWLMKAVANLSRNHLRRTTVQIKVFKSLSHEKINGYSDVEERLIGKEREILLNSAITKLPSQQQLVLYLSKEVGLRRQEIAAHLQISPNTVKVHLLRAMQFVKENICFILLFAIFCACNNLFFKSSNTNEGLRGLYKTTRESSTEQRDGTTSTDMPVYAMVTENI